MKEIKFDYILKNNTGFHHKVYSLNQLEESGLKGLFDVDQYELVAKRQFTNLQSSDCDCGMPIRDLYFGDIIRFFNTDGHEHKAEVIWYEREHCIGFRRLSDGFVYTQKIFNDSGYFQPSKIQFEIIGNIYENPELLKN